MPPQRPAPATRHPSLFGPLFLWLGIQFAALALGTFQMQWWAENPQPPQRLALHVMLIAQVAGAGMLFPILLRSTLATALASVVSLPFLFLASFLAYAPERSALLAFAFLAAWLAALRFWCALLKTPRARMAGVAFASALCAGGPVIAYAAAEFNASFGVVSGLHSPQWQVGPIVGAVNLLQTPGLACFLDIIAAFAAASVVWFAAILWRHLFNKSST